MAPTVRVEASASDAEIDLIREAILGLAEDGIGTGSGTIAVSRRETYFLCAEREGLVVPVLLDGRGVLIGPVLGVGPGCPCCAVARREQHGLRSGLVGDEEVLLAKGRAMTVATARLVAMQSLAMLKGAEGVPVIREVDPRSMTFRSWQLIPNEECHCAHI